MTPIYIADISHRTDIYANWTIRGIPTHHTGKTDNCCVCTAGIMVRTYGPKKTIELTPLSALMTVHVYLDTDHLDLVHRTLVIKAPFTIASGSIALGSM